MLADRLLEQLGNSASIKGQAAEQTVVNVVVSALRASGVSSVVPGPAQGGADLAIWSDDLSSSVGNPLLIEVKVNVTKSKDLMNASLQAFQYLQQSNARSAVVFYTRAPRSSLDITPAMYLPFVYVVELAGFLLDMKSASFPDLIRNLRNM